MDLVEARKIHGIHKLAAQVTGIPFVEISEDEAAALAKATNEIIEYYGFQPKGPVMLWINLAAVAGMVYVPRAMAINAAVNMMRAQRRQAQQTQQNGATVIEVPPGVDPVADALKNSGGMETPGGMERAA